MFCDFGFTRCIITQKIMARTKKRHLFLSSASPRQLKKKKYWENIQLSKSYSKNILVHKILKLKKMFFRLIFYPSFPCEVELDKWCDILSANVAYWGNKEKKFFALIYKAYDLGVSSHHAQFLRHLGNLWTMVHWFTWFMWIMEICEP